MQINIQGHNVQLTAPLREYAIKKIGKLGEFYNNIQKIEITLDVRNLEDIKRSQVAEVSVWLAGKKVVRAEEAGEDMYAAIDLVFEELRRQVVKHKEMRIKEARRSAEKIKEISRSVYLKKEDQEKERVVKLKRFDIKVMPQEEALAEKKMLGHDFFVFRNAETGDINVLTETSLLGPSDMNIYSEDEALLQLQSKEDIFISFLNSSTKEVNVLYKRKSGNFGLIEPSA